jgi:hypothetical protein
MPGMPPLQDSDPKETIPSRYIVRVRDSVLVLTTSGPPESPEQESLPRIETPTL